MSPPDASRTVTPSEEAIKYLDRSEGYVALSDPRRRYIIRLLDDADKSLSLLDLAREIVRWEQDVSDQDVEDEDVQQVLIALHHVHVPKLADAGFVRYNMDEQRVTLSAGAPLDFIEKFEA